MTKKGIIIRVLVFIMIVITLPQLIAPKLDEQLYRKFICCTEDKNAAYYNINGQEVYLDGEATIEDLEQFKQEFEEVIGYKFDYKIVLTTYDIATTYMYEEQIGEEWYITATTDAFAKVVYINTDFIQGTVLHELAHTIDLEYGFSETDFIIEQHSKQLDDSYMYFSPYEYFAECYRMYFENTLEDETVHEWFETVVMPQLGV